jgi:hypothetical protein
MFGTFGAFGGVVERSKNITTKTRKKRVPNPLIQLHLLMVTNEQNLKTRRLTNIATFVGKMVMRSLNVLRRCHI